MPGFPPQKVKTQILIDALHEAKCVCGETNFVPVFKVRVANRFQSPSGQPMLMQIPNGFLCASCGLINNYDKDTQKQIDMFNKEDKSGPIVDQGQKQES